MINKFLYPNGGSETYIFKLGACLQSLGHEVQYFGMEHENRIVGNAVNAYTSNMDFNGGSKLSKLLYPVKTIYSFEARKKIRLVLENFRPEICHLNNFNYQLTPSIILEICKWRKETGCSCEIIYTAHDGQLVCPNHLLKNPCTGKLCQKCLGGHFWECTKGKCIHGSFAKSMVGTMEGFFWNWMGVYRNIDRIVCPSAFMKTILDSDPILAPKTVAIHNFIEPVERQVTTKKDYVLYFGRYSEEKGIITLLQAAKELPQIQFVFAGSGPLEHLLTDIPNVSNVGFQTGKALEMLIRQAKMSVYPSEWYENCPFSVMESLMYGTPVVGADIGGIPELIRVGQTGELFESGNVVDLKQKIEKLWNSPQLLDDYTKQCTGQSFLSVVEYANLLVSDRTNAKS